MPLSPFAGPGERQYPPDYLDNLPISARAKEIVGDLHHEAQSIRQYGIAQHHLNEFEKELRAEWEHDQASREQQKAYDESVFGTRE